MNWIDVGMCAEVELTSEDATHTIEGALIPERSSGWRAAEKGTQTIRLHFDSPCDIHLVHLLFREKHDCRTQEFVLRWKAYTEETFREIVRQQYNFIPGATEVEDYGVNLVGVEIIELEIIPNVASGDAVAELAEFWFR